MAFLLIYYFEESHLSEQIVISSDFNEARVLENRLLSGVSECGFSDIDKFAIRLALEEGLVNAIKHGNKSDPDKQVTVTWDITEKHATFCITDEGNGFVPKEVPDPTSDENILRPCGRGLMLMRAYMDEVSFNNSGNQVRLIKAKSQD